MGFGCLSFEGCWLAQCDGLVAHVANLRAKGAGTLLTAIPSERDLSIITAACKTILKLLLALSRAITVFHTHL